MIHDIGNGWKMLGIPQAKRGEKLPAPETYGFGFMIGAKAVPVQTRILGMVLIMKNICRELL